MVLLVAYAFLASSHVMADAKAQPPKPPVQARKKTVIRTKVVVLGVRGLDEFALKESKPDYGELKKLDKYVPTRAVMDAFGHDGSEKLVSVDGASDQAIRPEDEKEEIRQGSEIAASLLGAAPLVANDGLQEYINRVGAWIARGSERPRLPWKFGVLSSDSINAFAVPGGYVFVTSGLWRKLGSEADLAGVLAHEISHVVARDHYKLLVLSRAMDAAGSASRKVMSKMPGFKRIAGATLEKSSEIFVRALDRGAEVDADRMALVLSMDAGYHPGGLVEVMKTLREVPHDDANAALLFKTHPSPEARLSELEPLVRQGRLASKSRAPRLAERFARFSL